MSILTVQHLEKHFENTKVLNDISFSLEEGQALSIIGSSGSGKTTLLRCLNFLETPDAGTITVQDKVLFDADHHANCSEKEIRKNRLHFGMVFQSFNLFPQYTALENVTLARELMAKDSGESKEAIRCRRNGAAGPDGPCGPCRALSASAFRRSAAAGGHRPGTGAPPGYSLL